MILMLAAALLLPQEAPGEWQRVGVYRGNMVVEIAPASIATEGATRRFRARMSAAGSSRTIFSPMAANCAAKTYWTVGPAEVQVDGEIVETRQPPPALTEPKGTVDDPIGTAIVALVCKQ